LQLKRSAITAIYLGCNCIKNKEIVLKYRESVDNNVLIYQAKKAPQKYGLVFEKLSEEST